ncbi:Mitochondrial fission protein [Ceratobasidium sp. 428]|nr:Mitochondrial fission protein [Ceratobasidium sp. 428]
MDILWAIAHPAGGDFSEMVEAPYDFSSSMIAEHDDRFVGGLQFWGYALVSGSADGAVRMWDMRTGQAHRTLLGHTAPISAVQFDETHVVSSSRDGTVRVWDLRSGGRTVELLRFGAARQEFGLSAGVSVSEYSNVGGNGGGGAGGGGVAGFGVGDVQFDTRKIVAGGDTGVEIFNRITQQYTSLSVNGHVGPVERLRYIDRYLVSGGQDATVKIWAL